MYALGQYSTKIHDLLRTFTQYHTGLSISMEYSSAVNFADQKNFTCTFTLDRNGQM